MSRAWLRDVRECPEVVEAFARDAARRGLSATAALRELVRAYNAKPWPFKKVLSRGRKDGRWGDLRLEQSAAKAFTAHARHHGVSGAEALRQCVRRHLEHAGATQWKSELTPERLSLGSPGVVDKVLELVSQDRTSAEMAEALGVSTKTITAWKRKLGLGRPVISAADNPLAQPGVCERVVSLLAEGLNDAEVAERLGVNFNAFRQWKRRAGLTRPGAKGRASGRTPAVDAQLRDMLKHGRTQDEIAVELGVSPSTVYRWARPLGIRTRSANDLAKPGAKERMAALIAEGLTNAQLAEAFNVAVGTLSNWKTRYGLCQPGTSRGKRVGK